MLNDTALSTTTGASLATSFIERHAVGIIGAQQSDVSKAIALIAQTHNVMQLSYQPPDDVMMDKELYPLFGTVSVLLLQTSCFCHLSSLPIPGSWAYSRHPEPDAGRIPGTLRV